MSRARMLVGYTVAVTALQAAIVLATNSHRAFFGAVGPGAVLDDVRLYFKYASSAMAGAIPYRDYLIEYPIWSFPIFFFPRLLAADFARYRVAFGAEMLLLNAGAVYLVARRVERSEGMGRVAGRLAWYTLFFASMCPVVIGRYDLAPMALTFAAALLWFSGRSTLGGAAAGCATLLKVFPGVLVAPALVWEASQRGPRRGRGLVAFVVSTAAGMGLWLALGGSQVRDSLAYHADRGLEIGSLYAGMSIPLGWSIGAPVTTDFNHASTELVAPWSLPLARIAFPLQAAGMLLVAWRFRRSGMADPMRYTAAALLAFIIFGKVLSPQYLIWLFPFIAILGGKDGQRARWLFLLCCLVTTMIYPHAINRIVIFRDGWAVGLLNYRNALLLGLWALLLFGPEARPATIGIADLRSRPQP